MREEIMAGNTTEPLVFGFDIGIASVGWCALGENRIVDLGVRCFDKAETAKEGESLNLARRTARLMRRRLRRRAWRLTKLTRLLKRSGVIAGTDFFRRPQSAEPNPWRWRVAGLDRRLETGEWVRVLYHLCKHRGFHWISRAEEKKAEGDPKGEGGRVKKGLADTQRRMAEKGYRSAAEMILAEFPEAQRNKAGNYSKALSRLLLGDELKLLFGRQRDLGNPHATPELEAAILGDGSRKRGLFWQQKPPLAGADLLKMLGRCTFEKSEFRAPKASFTAERHVLLTRVNNLRIVVDGHTRPLAEDERRIALALPYEYADAKATYKQLRTALKKIGQEHFQFAGIAEDKEKDTLVKLPAWEALSKALKSKGLETEWKGIAGAAISGDPTLLDEIARVLSVYKDGDEVEAELRKLNLPGGEAMLDALGEISFDKFHNLSLKALRKIVPHMEAGLRYDEAVAAIPEYRHHSQLHVVGAGDEKYLPPLYSHRNKDGRMVFDERLDVPRNPVVLRALNQARKVLNALVRRYGSPTAVHVEMARDLSRPLDERNKVKRAQDEYRERNDKDKAAFAEEFGMPAKSREFEKFQLYREQQGKCAYSLAPFDLDRVLRDTGYAEVDHALPYSRSFDDGKNNKVLVLAEENRNKGNRTPYEYLDGAGDSPRWLAFTAFVESNKSYRLAKRQRLLRKDFGDRAAAEFRERNLNDTRYICRFFKNWVERHLKLADGSDAKRCVVLSGQTTAFLRARWGLVKLRGASDRHHALDAAVVAACSHGMVQRLARYSKEKELSKVRDGFVDLETGEIVDPAMHRQLERHFPDPWPGFRQELDARLHIDNAEELRAKMAALGSYDEAAIKALRPLFVSRAPQRRNGGAAHKDTIYGQPERLKAHGGVTQKFPLASLTLKDIDKLIDPHRNEKLYAAIRTRLEAHGGKGDKAFPADNPLHKPDREGNPTGPVVRTVTLVIDKLSGIPVRHGIAKNDSMLRVDVFRQRKDGKFHLVPIYVHHAAIWKRTGELPNRAIVAFKDEDNWTVIDNNFDFCFSLYTNDLVRVSLKSEAPYGYYSGCDRSTGAISLWAHDRNQAVGKDGLFRGIGIKTALAVEKFHVDTLGNIYPAPPEQRRGLA
jgi:CRISPR-associated endonuclease Csn1